MKEQNLEIESMAYEFPTGGQENKDYNRLLQVWTPVSSFIRL